MTLATKPISVIILTLFSIVSIACGKSADSEDSSAKNTPVSTGNAVKDDSPANVKPDKIAVYYFHGTRRCPTCLGIQKGISDTIEDKFKQAIEAGMLVFEEFNTEDSANKHYAEKFNLSFSTMIVAAQAGDKIVKWINADKVWQYAHQQEDLKAYVEENVNAYLKLLTE